MTCRRKACRSRSSAGTPKMSIIAGNGASMANPVSDMYVDIGGRSLHVVKCGHGSPAVILEAGSGCSSEHWRAVQELAGELAATCSYDRAGHGSSDPGDPWTLDGWVADLEAWLAAARIPPPYLLVGHS